MSNPREITTEIVAVDRLTNSRNGNPRWTLTTPFSVLTTKTDAAVGFEVENVTRRLPVRVTIRLDGHGKVWDLVPVK